MDNPFDDLPTVAEQYPNGAPAEQQAAEKKKLVDLMVRVDHAEQEVAALNALVVEQAEALSEMVPAPTQGEQQRLQDLEEFEANAQSYLEDYLSAVCGSSRPRIITTPELKALADFIFEGVQ